MADERVILGGKGGSSGTGKDETESKNAEGEFHDELPLWDFLLTEVMPQVTQRW